MRLYTFIGIFSLLPNRLDFLQNHLIETASHSTGSLLIWDTGEYSVLPYRQKSDPQSSSSEDLDRSEQIDVEHVVPESQKLHDAFRQGKIRLRLHGTRLPHDYTIGLRLSKDDHCTTVQPGPPRRRRRKLDPKMIRQNTQQTSSSESENDASTSSSEPPIVLKKENLTSFRRTASPPLKAPGKSIPAQSSPGRPRVPEEAKDDSSGDIESLTRADNGLNTAKNATTTHSEDESETIRLTNAYPGAINTISSIHQRRWFLSLDRHNSGFMPQRDKRIGQKVWVRRSASDGFEKFHVLGREVERSVVTGRLAAEILEDESVIGFVPRGGWRGVME